MLRFFSRLGVGGSAPSSPVPPADSLNNTGFSAPHSVNENSWTAAFASDPSEWERSFERFWARAEKYLDKVEMNPEHQINYDEMSTYVKLLSQMCQLLMMEVNAQPEPAIGPILDRFFTQQILERTMDWAIQVPVSFKPVCQLSLIRIYEGIVSESHTQNHCLLVHKPVLNPLLRLFEWCRRADSQRRPEGPSGTDKHFVLLLNQICTKMAEDATLLHFFFTCSEGADQFVVFSLLVKFLYEQNDVGQLARDALLLILSVSSKNDAVAEFVATKSAFCPVVATGLSGCFSQLGRVLAGDGQIADHSSDALTDFHSSLLFCNAVTQAAHPYVVEKIASFFYSGFLLSVVKPALLQEEREYATAATTYLHVCLQTVSEEALIQTIVRMLLLERDEDNNSIIYVIISRIEAGDRLASVSLELLDCLLQLGCEDVMLVLCLRHLLPLRHTTRAHVSHVRDRSHTLQVAQRLMACVPECALKFMDIASPLTLHLYLREGAAMVEKRAITCGVWKWKYDGSQPSALLFRTDSDDEPNTPHSPFTRLSSCRSSMSSAAQGGLNRYFASKNAHLTAESGMGVRLADLGASQPPSPMRTRSPSPDGEQDADFILPPITSSSLMTSSMVDYFQLVAYDDLSDDPPSSPERVVRSIANGVTQNGNKDSRKEQNAERSENESSSNGGGRGFDTDAEMARSFVLTGWADVEDLDTFKSLLDRRSIHSRKVASVAENMAFIDSKIQYMRELADEKEEQNIECDRTSNDEETQRNDEALRGQPIEEGGDTGLFLDLLLSQLESMTSHSLSFNLQLASVLSSLAAYPQPILIAFLFDTEGNDRFPQLIKILESLKSRLDAFANSFEGIEVYLGRSLRQLNQRAERIERQNDYSVARHSESPREDAISFLLRGRPFGGSGRRQNTYRYHTHKVVESREAARTDEMVKNCVHAVIVLSNLVQQLAAIALHHSVAVVPHYVERPVKEM